MGTLEHTIAQGLGGHTVDGEFYRLRADQEEIVLNGQNDYHEKCTETNALGIEVEALPDGLDGSEANVNGVTASVSQSYSEKINYLHQLKRILEAHRCRQGLTCAPIDPDILKNALLFGIMAFIEGMFNASFFLTAHISASPISALLLSLLISITNIVVSCCAGFYIGRWLDHGLNAVDSDNFKARRIIARLQFWCFILFIGWFHITVGLIRYLETIESVEHTLTNYWGVMTTPEAFFLILIGMVMTTVSYKKSMSAFDDPSPGYGERNKAVLAAKDALLDFQEESQEEIETRFDDALKNAEKTCKAKVKVINQYNARVQNCIQARHKLEQVISRAESTLKTQIAVIVAHHRTANDELSSVSEDVPEHLTSFQSYLENIEIPPFMHTPDFQAFKCELNQSKANALKQLDQIFEQVLNQNGEKS
jgi:hypothetical protein